MGDFILAWFFGGDKAVQMDEEKVVVLGSGHSLGTSLTANALL